MIGQGWSEATTLSQLNVADMVNSMGVERLVCHVPIETGRRWLKDMHEILVLTFNLY